TSDHSKLEQLMGSLFTWTDKDRVNIALPSLRVDNFSPELLEMIQRVRKSGLTFAPEAGSQRLRDAINKNVTEEELMNTCRMAFEGGYTAVKLYFMMGLPTESMEDITAINQLAQKVVDLFYSLPTKPKGKGVAVTVSVACFVPKPFTPFQFEPQDTLEQFREKQKQLMATATSRKIKVNYHEALTSRLEAVLARGDRRLCDVIEAVYNAGGILEGWEQHLRPLRWMEAMEQQGLSMDFYASRRREYDELMPWEHLNYGVSKDFLIQENKKAWESVVSPNCRSTCTGCGANKLLGGACFEYHN
ncbi:MAG: B12-binding domain-containing radical SAM protein, partial [Angelakisella sp.]